MDADFTIIVPARLKSTRLPNKALADIGGKPMVVRVAERAALSSASAVYIATDDEQIAQTAQSSGFTAILTDTRHLSGTSRLSEAVEKLKLTPEALVINVQGDEPFISPTLINTLANHLHQHPHLSVATACAPLKSKENFLNPNIVKVVLDKTQTALYFSRAPIPYPRDACAQDGIHTLPLDLPAYQHIGIYAYRAQFLQSYPSLSISPLEHFESLEQLRILWHGIQIGVLKIEEHATIGVDTAEDLLKAQQRWREEYPL